MEGAKGVELYEHLARRIAAMCPVSAVDFCEGGDVTLDVLTGRNPR
jgi:hypothetical protein